MGAFQQPIGAKKSSPCWCLKSNIFVKCLQIWPDYTLTWIFIIWGFQMCWEVQRQKSEAFVGFQVNRSLKRFPPGIAEADRPQLQVRTFIDLLRGWHRHLMTERSWVRPRPSQISAFAQVPQSSSLDLKAVANKSSAAFFSSSPSFSSCKRRTSGCQCRLSTTGS